MLLNVDDDRAVQVYLDRMEQQLHYHKFPLFCAGIRLQMSRGGIPATTYVNTRGEPALLRHYKRIYRDVYTAIHHQIGAKKLVTGLPVFDTKAARTGASRFMDEQMSYLERHAASRIADISQSLADDVRDVVMRGVRAGLSNDQIARALTRDIPDFSRVRAARIARTETHNAAMAAAWESLKYRNVPVRTKTWMTANDERVRPSHRDLHGVTIPVDEPFEAESGPMMYPGDSSLGAGAEDIVNCRCTPIYRT